MSGSNTTVFGMPTGAFDLSVSKRAVFVGAILGILVNMSALLVPILNYVGGGIVAGFVAAYIVGGPRGWLHGIMAGIIAGLVGGFIVVFMGGLIGLYTEPPTLMQDLVVGIISPMFTGMGAIGLLFILLMIAAFITIDSIIGGIIGGLLRTLVDTAFRR
jgi:hypothetical protein